MAKDKNSHKFGGVSYNLNELEFLDYNKNLKPINQVLDETFKHLGFYKHILAAKIQKKWTEIAGTAAAAYTAEIQIINNRLYVKILSPALRQNLHLRRNQILKQINQQLKADLQDIVIY